MLQIRCDGAETGHNTADLALVDPDELVKTKDSEEDDNEQEKENETVQ